MLTSGWTIASTMSLGTQMVAPEEGHVYGLCMPQDAQSGAANRLLGAMQEPGVLLYEAAAVLAAHCGKPHAGCLSGNAGFLHDAKGAAFVRLVLQGK